MKPEVSRDASRRSHAARSTRRATICRQRLRRRTAVLAAVSLAATLAVGWLAVRVVGVAGAVRWTLVASATLLLVVGLLATRLDDNRPVAEREGTDGGQLAPTLGPATHVTVGRGVLLAWVAGCFALAWATLPAWTLWLPALGHGAAAALDAVDGALARRTRRVTRLGARLDLSFDALGLLVAPLVGVVAGQLPWWYLSVGLARYGFVAGIRLREYRGLPVYELPTRASRRLLAGLQMAFVAVALTPLVPPAAGTVGAALFGGALLAGFVRDWGYVSGRLADAETGETADAERPA
ncbi:CDP-diacylglycerol--glycerol-3-phosphate 3-phosphatidyltransferase [Halogranum gelatinilyticum]|uniref:CDP-diacylglycerol--glycerol-3-phosphate 3-phosphatidyltransferase n=1 Tax=Halogranum gelatinilyticum TaxID=660521 RepID=A0A1G9REL9_9EURY|nr:CDP-alcohol phosphatidyltransferase family protein [Halogranum gelatinilyticum]SDM21769.1 CDP-diacylglycerol--glycerol-3-phosphate 3-phosphatidyltransferase [Halogranum gelatinilyticum]